MSRKVTVVTSLQRVLLIVSMLIVSIAAQTTKTVGTGGDYATLKDAFDAINAGSITGALTLNVISGTTEAAVCTLNASGTGAASYTSLLIQPSGGAAQVITGALNSELILFSGADNVTINGLNSGGNSLTISNTSATAAAATIKFMNDASGNTITNCSVLGATTSNLTGTIWFSTTTGTTGNDNNTVSNSDVGPAGANPACAIYSAGTSLKENSGITITNCNIYDYFNAASVNYGIQLTSTGNTNWTISNNRFYQTGSRTFTTGLTHSIISILTGTDYTIYNNIFGYSSNTQIGTYTLGGAVASRLNGILLTALTTGTNIIRRNVFSNFSFSTTSGASTVNGIWCGINFTAGSATIDSNRIGSTTATGVITTTTTTTGGLLVGICSQSSGGDVTIQNDTVAGCLSTGTSATASIGSGFIGINVSAGAAGRNLTVRNNLIGSNTTAHSNQVINTNASPTGSFSVIGIVAASGFTGNVSIANNTVRNLSLCGPSNRGTGTTMTLSGITNASIGGVSGAVRIDSNTIRDLNAYQTLTTASTTVTTGLLNSGSVVGQQLNIRNNIIRDIATTSAATSNSAPAISGINQSGGTTNYNIAGNQIFNLSCTHSTAGNFISGITISGTSTNGTLQGNLLYDYSIASTSTSSGIAGITLSGSNTGHIIQNNVMRFVLSNDKIIIGINELSNAATTYQIRFNTIYIGGTAPAANVGNSRCINKQVSTTTFNVESNILCNVRTSGAGSSAKNVCLFAAAFHSLYSANGNNLYAPNFGGLVGSYGTSTTVDYSTIASFRAAFGYESAGFSANPLFTDPTAATPDLTLQNPNPQSQAGIRNTSVTTDFAGNVRPGTPGERPDIGAYEGNFSATPNSMDYQPPLITINETLPLVNSPTGSSKVLTSFATIEDNVSLQTGTYAPRLYYRRTIADADDFTASNSGSNNSSGASGWRYVTGTTSGSGIYSFTIDYTLLNGGSVAAGDSIGFFVSAVDNSTAGAVENLGTVQAGAVASASPAMNNISSPFATLQSNYKYFLATGLSGTITVGTGGDYPDLTGVSGVFNKINTSAITGDVTVAVISDLTETGTTSLSQFPAPYKVRIRPRGSLTVRKIEGTAVASLAPMININGADRVIIDGADSATNGGRYLRFINNSATATTTGPVFRFINDARADTLKNIIIESNSSVVTGASVLLSTTTGGSGNDSIVVDSCLFKESAGTNAGRYFTAVSSTGSGTGAQRNSDNTFIDNSFTGTLTTSNSFVNISGTGNGDNWSFVNNKFYNSVIFAVAHSSLLVSNSTTNNVLVSGNSFGGSNPDRSGTYFGGASGVAVYACSLLVGGTVSSSVQGNYFGNFGNVAGTAITSAIANCIVVSGGKVNIGTVTGNVLGGLTNPWDTLITSYDNGWITVNSGTDTVTIENNLIANANYWRNRNDRNSGITISGTSVIYIIRNNTIRDLSGNPYGSSASFTTRGMFLSTSTSGNILEGNTIYNIQNFNNIVSPSVDSSAYVHGVVFGGSGSALVQRNRIYNLSTVSTQAGSSTPQIIGILVAGTNSLNILNNQITINNSVGGPNVYGIRMDGNSGNNSIMYNSIVLMGTAAGTLVNSACYRRVSNSVDTLKNNLFYNSRTGGLNNTAVSTLLGTNWVAGNSNNAYVVNSLSAVCDSAGVTKSLVDWKNGMSTDNNTIESLVSALPVANLFTNVTTGDLHINTANSEKNFLDNFGTPITWRTTDYDGDTRSTTTTDIGSDEFSPGLFLNSLLRLTAIVEGLYNTGSNTMIADTMKVYLRRTTTPYTVVDSSTVLLSTAGQGVYTFAKQIRDSSFYLQLYNKRALETWSKTGVLFNADTVSYDFTTAANKAYGDNQALRGTKYCLYSGDVNQDGVIDLSDIIVIDNDNANFVTGDVSTDLNGDGVVDLSDLLLADNNNANFIARVTPLSGKRVVNPRPVKLFEQIKVTKQVNAQEQ